ncbi:elongation factor P [Thermoproteota archaeon]
MPLQINDLRGGVTVAIEGGVFVIVSVDHVKPGKGSAFARCKLKNLRLGTVIERTYKSSEKIQDAFIKERNIQYSYHDGDLYHFLDQNTFEDIRVSKETLGSNVDFLKDNLIITANFYENEIVSITLPKNVSFKITHTEPGIRGDTAKGATKPATIETGATITVPLFINIGDTIIVDTLAGEYAGRE